MCPLKEPNTIVYTVQLNRYYDIINSKQNIYWETSM